MKGRFSNSLHLLSALPVLESAVRLGSFTAAGRELGLKQPTVSRHIMNLEEDLGLTLFHRDHNRLSVTPEGQRLANAVALGFTHVDRLIQEMRSRNRQDSLALACNLSFSHCWLLPRFSRFRHALDDYPVDINASYHLRELDLDHADLIIASNPEGITNWPRIPLFDERVFPVCSPGFLENHPELEGGSAFLSRYSQMPLLHLQRFDPGFPNWATWFETQGVEYESQNKAYEFANYEFLIAAAKEGEGIALAWDYLTELELERGELVKIGAEVEGRKPDVWLEYREERISNELLQKTLNWFRNESHYS